VAALGRPFHVPALVLLALAVASGASAQTGQVAVDRENLRAAPGGSILADLPRGTRLVLGAERDGWRQATLEGWIWSASVRPEQRDGHDLVVAPGGENLRADPGGQIIARLRGGMLLDRVSGSGNWVRVRRSAWIWAGSIRADETRPGTGTPVAARSPQTPAAARPAAGAPGPQFGVAGARGLPILLRPEGDTVARVSRGGSVEVLGREGEWVRVRVEGWAPASALMAREGAVGQTREAARAALQEDPEALRGQLVEWTIQFIALQKAERFRTDFAEGETFILARGPGDDPGFVYLAVPEDQMSVAQGLTALERVRVLARVRNPRSPLTDAPILDLVAIAGREGSGPR
jgi:hypothetical protein